ncbi:MAG: DUF4298 domain-containing protein [Tenacibaculum sp.]|nr:DUF4298 domain-containing protein [Tenacibaculum sp.]
MENNKEVYKKLEKYEEMYKDLSLRMDKLYKFKKEFKKFSKDLRKLGDYYDEEWLDDLDKIKDEKRADDFEITSEDTIWNLLSDHYEYNKELIKVLAKELNR